MNTPSISPSDRSDLPRFQSMFEAAIRFQKDRGGPSWPGFDENVILSDIQDGRHFSLWDGKQLAGFFSLQYADPAAWGDHEQDTSVYLHRIVIDPEYRGKKLFGTLLDWTKAHAKKQGRTEVRMDTWAAAPRMRDYYLSFGFTLVGTHRVPDREDISPLYRNLEIVLMEMGV